MNRSNTLQALTGSAHVIRIGVRLICLDSGDHKARPISL